MTATMVTREIPTEKAGILNSRPTPLSSSAPASDHAGKVAKAVAKRFGRSPVARQHEIDKARELFSQIAQIAVADAAVRQWIPFFIAPLTAATLVHELEGSLQELIDAKCAADSAEDLVLFRCGKDDTPENRTKLLRSLRIEVARAMEVIAYLEAPGEPNAR